MSRILTAAAAKEMETAVHSDLSIYDLSLSTGVDPMVLVAHLHTQGHIDAPPFSEEEATLRAMALDGIPLGMLLPWCKAEDDRLPLEIIQGAGFGADLDAAFELARIHRILVPDVLHIESLCTLVGTSSEEICDAIKRLANRFEVATACSVSSELACPCFDTPDYKCQPSLSRTWPRRASKKRSRPNAFRRRTYRTSRKRVNSKSVA